MSLPALLRYTKNNIQLTLNQRLFYEKNGYLIFPRLVPEYLINKCHQRFDDIVDGKERSGDMTVMYDVKDKKSVSKMQNLNNDPVFRLYLEYKDILDIVECFTGPNILAMHNMLIAKPPDIGYGSTRHPPHQDMYYFPFRPVDSIVGVWTAMEPCDVTNGCLFISPGTHTAGRLYPHDYPPGKEPGTVNKFYHGILIIQTNLNRCGIATKDLPNSMHWIDLEMQPGDTVFFHPLLIHGSGINKSTKSRRAISCHYAATECSITEDLEPAQKLIKKEIMDYINKKYPGVELTYTDIWRLKSTVVRGVGSYKSSL